MISMFQLMKQKYIRNREMIALVYACVLGSGRERPKTE